jgi:hypothetical protein
MPTHGGSPLPLSVAIVCKNNEGTIARTLESVAPLAAEIVALDSGSTDRTIPILESFGARVEHVRWQGHVKTKHLALEACSQAWILCVDSDESVEPDLAASIRAAVLADRPGVAGHLVNRRVWYRGRFLSHVWQPERRLRLVRHARARWTGLDPHDKLEIITPDGRPASAALPCLDGTLRHDSFESFADHFRTQCAHSRTKAASLHAAGARGAYTRLLLSPPGAFLKQLVLKRGFLDGYAGWLAAASTAAGALMKHAMLIELSRQEAEKPSASRPSRTRDSKTIP